MIDSPSRNFGWVMKWYGGAATTAWRFADREIRTGASPLLYVDCYLAPIDSAPMDTTVVPNDFTYSDGDEQTTVVAATVDYNPDWLPDTTDGFVTEGLPATDEPIATTEDDMEVLSTVQDDRPSEDPTLSSTTRGSSRACCPVIAASFGDQRSWFASACGVTYAMPCGEDSMGTVKRRCGTDGAWNEEDTSGCSHLELEGLVMQLLDRGNTSSLDDVLAYIIDLCK
jgi:hypothetical protein